MAKSTNLFVCKNCGNESAKWMGKCLVCGEWNTYKEITASTFSSKGTKKRVEAKKASVLKDVKSKELTRVKTGIKEFDKALGDGLVPGQVILLAGEPGIGKSTILLQIADKLGEVFYVSGEESLSQLKIRADRLSVSDDFYSIAETNLDVIVATLEKLTAKTDIKAIFIDSVQTLYSDDLPGVPGSVSQVKESALTLIRFAKSQHIPVILVGHVTKDGSVAGPSTLMHMVDTVAWFEGERGQNTRILRIMKNRFGTTDEIALFAMAEKGLIGVSDLDDHFFSKDRITNVPGSVASCVMEGTRSLLVEVQSLVVPSNLTIPRRVVQGIDSKRVELILAVLARHCRVNVSNMDVFVNIVGGIKVRDPLLDLAVAISIVSSARDKTIPDNIAAIGEVGLLGDVRQTANSKKCVSHIKNRKMKPVGPNKTNICQILKEVFK